MSATNPTTIEELLAMPTPDIAAMSDADLDAWCTKFFPATRPLKVTQNAIARETERIKGSSAGSKLEEMLAAARAKKAAATINIKNLPK